MEEMTFTNQKPNHPTLSKKHDETQQTTAHGIIDRKKSARQGIVEVIFVNRIKRMAFKRRTWENFMVTAFSRINRMWQSNEGVHETSLISAIETFTDDLIKWSLCIQTTAKGNHLEKKEIRTDCPSQVLVSQQKMIRTVKHTVDWMTSPKGELTMDSFCWREKITFWHFFSGMSESDLKSKYTE